MLGVLKAGGNTFLALHNTSLTGSNTIIIFAHYLSLKFWFIKDVFAKAMHDVNLYLINTKTIVESLFFIASSRVKCLD